MKERLATTIARTVDARARCLKTGSEWATRHTDTLLALARRLPRGAGLDSGTSIDLERSTGEHLVLQTSFHHMNEHGFYDGWTEHTVHVRPSLVFGLDVHVTGSNRNEIRDYLTEVFSSALAEEADHLQEIAARSPDEQFS